MDKKTGKLIKKEERKVKRYMAKHKRLGVKIRIYLFLYNIVRFIDFLVGYPFVILSLLFIIYFAGGGYKEDYFSITNFPSYFVSFVRITPLMPVIGYMIGIILLSYAIKSSILWKLEKFFYIEKIFGFDGDQYILGEKINEGLAKIHDMKHVISKTGPVNCEKN